MCSLTQLNLTCLFTVTMVDHMTRMRLEGNQPLTLGPHFTQPGFSPEKRKGEQEGIHRIIVSSLSQHLHPTVCCLNVVLTLYELKLSKKITLTKEIGLFHLLRAEEIK